MFGWLTNLRNKRSAEKYGWQPSWFGATKFDADLAKKVGRLQEVNGFWSSGVCNYNTYKLILLVKLKRIRRRMEWRETKKH